MTSVPPLGDLCRCKQRAARINHSLFHTITRLSCCEHDEARKQSHARGLNPAEQKEGIIGRMTPIQNRPRHNSASAAPISLSESALYPTSYGLLWPELEEKY